MNAWPPVRVVHAALRYVARNVFKTEAGRATAGVKSAVPWIYLQVIEDATGALCERCRSTAGLPDPPKWELGPLFSTDSRLYAGYVLTHTLYPFFRKHEACARPEPAPAPTEKPTEATAA